MKNYMKFAERMIWAMEENYATGRDSDDDNAMFYDFKHSHVFEVDSNITELLMLTNNEYRPNIHLPFRNVFIDAVVDVEGFSVYGILLTDITKESMADRLTIVVSCHVDHPDKRMSYVTRTVLGDVYLDPDEYALPQHGWLLPYPTRRKILKRVHRFALNFLDFLNSPDIKFVEHKRTQESNAKRIRKGKMPLPPSTVVTVTGELKVYIDDLKTTTHLPYSHRFWVRGHYMHFWDREYYENLYSMSVSKLRKEGYQVDGTGLISKLVLPYIKGQGILIDKRYIVKDKK